MEQSVKVPDTATVRAVKRDYVRIVVDLERWLRSCTSRP